ncbi:unnamed protein product [Rotaria socialis]|uniref:Uncharacterized protein n=1 Tax=Rotaria socialis TaxID=392032 RepID=A0A818MA88_9BILA|nr:unnamed protein product [Rotaria socialis]CAF3585404.1 unnamed protein product [Rotaria socialis]CAF3684037.1 unnamed protein product [Rotaria socialis]CAF4127579.1 unnamed protein product [Rotaria socialis]CAF4566145.1 unnamed protein product [Rotaria socialis]
MLSTINFCLAASIIIVVRSHIWTGIFLIEPECNTTVCCCASGKLVITNKTNDNFEYKSDLIGKCNNRTKFQDSASSPSGFSTSVRTNNQNYTITLSLGSNVVIATHETTAECSFKAYRESNAGKQFGNTILMVALILIVQVFDK